MRLILATVLGALMALPAMADPIPLSEISRYFNSFTTAQGQFTQINGDGSISTGTLYINRPGRIRFEYAPPDSSLVMAGGGQVAIFDPKSNQPPEQYPLSRTPLNLILAQTVDLTQARMVVGHVSDGTTTTVVAQDPQRPEQGSIELNFTANPTELRQWVIRDDTGGATTVVLSDLTKDVQLSSFLFNIPHEVERRR
ncbi:outer membrane lipoprotein carrier protein LolA [Plastorhodobacter daqingensis]|uniref:Outer membrane lipoprotein carrier protein LolA n=1 Tax=Plastorhodobacter daqingensis TaxID=1387281 RepID=A0ABW2ULV3_9RHOB